jgi:hypothetical protein
MSQFNSARRARLFVTFATGTLIGARAIAAAGVG